MKMFAFAKRNFKEITRDPLSYLFCLLLPIILLLVFQMINSYTPEAVWFKPNSLTPGICVFSLSFVMLFMALLVSKDKSTSLLSRLVSSPLRTVDYILGYVLPGLLIAFLQMLICVLSSAIIALVAGAEYNLGMSFVMIIAYIPLMVMFVCFGILFGCLFSDKAAPGVSSFIISLSGFVSGAWMPVETLGSFETVCMCLPFYPATRIGRAMLSGGAYSFDNFWLPIIVCLLYLAVMVCLTIVAFGKKLTSDNR